MVQVKGFSTDHNRFSNFFCYKMSVSSEGVPSLDVNLNSEYSVESIAQDFGTSIGAGLAASGSVPISKFASLGFSLYGLSSENSFLSSSLSQSGSQSFSYAVVYNFPTNIYTSTDFGLDFLTDVGKEHYQTWLDTNDPYNPYFRHICGDKVMISEERYAAVYYTIQVQYQSLFTQESSFSSGGVSLGFLGLSQSVSEAIATETVFGTQKMNAYQVGGNLLDFSQQVSDSLTCSYVNIDNCESLAVSWQNYATSFVSSVESDANSVRRGSPTLTSISNFAINPGFSVLTTEIISARSAINDLYEDNKKYVSVLERYVQFFSLVPGISNDFEESVSALQSIVNANLDVIEGQYQGAPQCYDSPVDCPNSLVYINSEIVAFTPELMNLYDIRFKYYFTNFFGCEGVNLIPNSAGEWIFNSDNGNICLISLKSHFRTACAGGGSHSCDKTGKIKPIEFLDFTVSKYTDDTICGTVRYEYNDNRIMSDSIKCTSAGRDIFSCDGTKLLMFQNNVDGDLFSFSSGKGKCQYYAVPSGPTIREINPYYISDFDGSNGSLEDYEGDSCPSISSYDGCTGLTGGEVAGVVVGSFVGAVLMLAGIRYCLDS